MLLSLFYLAFGGDIEGKRMILVTYSHRLAESERSRSSIASTSILHVVFCNTQSADTYGWVGEVMIQLTPWRNDPKVCSSLRRTCEDNYPRSNGYTIVDMSQGLDLSFRGISRLIVDLRNNRWRAFFGDQGIRLGSST